MICSRCQKEISDDSIFCPHCGIKINKCPQCQQPLKPNAKFCSYCGVNLNPNHQENQIQGEYIPLSKSQSNENIELEVSNEDISVSKPVNKKKIMIAVCVLIILSVISYLYLFNGEPLNIKENNHVDLKPNDIEVLGKNEEVSYFGNINQQGEVFYDETNVYMIAENNTLVKMDKSLENKVTLTNQATGYINVISNKVYYTNDKNYLCVVDNDGKNQQVIIEKAVFYVVVKDNKVIYQLDEDNESIHIYDIDTKEDQKINDRQSYNINVIDQMIYYSSTDGIYSIAINGEEDKKLTEVADAPQVLYHDGLLYYKNDQHMSTFDIQNKDIINKGQNNVAFFFNMNDKYIYYYSTKRDVVRYDIEQKETKVIYSGSIESLYLVGDKIIMKTPANDKVKSSKIIMDLDGDNQQRLFNAEGTFI